MFKLFIGFLIISASVFAQSQTNVSTSKSLFTFDATNFDYGNIPEDGGYAVHAFKIENTGSDPLVINQVVASCGCTVADWTKEPIAPGKTGEIKASYDPRGHVGAFDKTIDVYLSNSNPVQLTIKGNVTPKSEEAVPVFTTNEILYDFGTIAESDGYADHVFKFKNTGTSALSISNIQTSCGCTRPEWTKNPVAPSEEGVIIITFNPKGRLGSFDKTATVYTNEDGGFKRHKLRIVGTVVSKPTENPYTVYLDTIGGVGIENKVITYKSFNSSNVNKKTIFLKNFNTETAYFSFENMPEYITVQYPDSLKADWALSITVDINATKANERKGRITEVIDFTVRNSNGNILGRDKITATVNYIDDFSNMSPLQTVSAPTLEIKNTMIDFGDSKKGTVGKSASKQFILTNTGKSDLILHSVSSDDSRVHIPDLKGKTIKAGETLTVNTTVKGKEVSTQNIDTDIYVVCNDPKGPVRMIKVTAPATASKDN